MARTEMVRFHCTCCGNIQDITQTSKYPSGWKQFASRQTEPLEGEQSHVIDLCPDHASDFMDFIFGKNGAHRARAISVPSLAVPVEVNV